MVQFPKVSNRPFEKSIPMGGVAVSPRKAWDAMENPVRAGLFGTGSFRTAVVLPEGGIMGMAAKIRDVSK